MTEKDLELFKMDQGKNESVRRSRIKFKWEPCLLAYGRHSAKRTG